MTDYTTKTCSKCKIAKPLDKFNRDSKNKDGLCCRCRDCANQANLQYRNKPEVNQRLREYMRQYRIDHPGYAKRCTANHRAKYPERYKAYSIKYMNSEKYKKRLLEKQQKHFINIDTNKVDGYVYFIQQGDAVKIGYSKNVEKRFLILKTASPYTLCLLGYMAGSRNMEKKLHHDFSHLRLEGEWFRMNPELINFINSCL